MCGMSERVEAALPFKVWCDCITNMIQTADYKYNKGNHSILIQIRALLDHLGDELLRLKEAMTCFELALWKSLLDENNHQWGMANNQKKNKTDKFSTRQQCRVSFGTDVIIGLVLLFLSSA